MDQYNPARDVTDAFVARVAAWIKESGELLVVLRYLRAAGAKSYALCRTREEFESVVKSVPSGTAIEVVRGRQLPYRGIVDEAFIEGALRQIAEGEEYLLVTIDTQPPFGICRFGDISDSRDDLRECLADLTGTEVAVGLCPNFLVLDGNDLISAAKDGIDGPR